VVAEGVARIGRRPPALHVVEERHARLRREGGRNADLVQRDRVGLLDTERRVVRLDPGASGASVGPVQDLLGDV
jgi:hypothetical protein